MRLQRLEIKGFKSFANETVIHFNEDVIGVVGPNGAGKSNLVDAIRWVLGEQKSKDLRLDKMSDVIFNGTKKHFLVFELISQPLQHSSRVHQNEPNCSHLSEITKLHV